jgi:Tol biopolymer transport system component/DNA-binding winged helix-turn-helix (wHTH) protein
MAVHLHNKYLLGEFELEPEKYLLKYRDEHVHLPELPFQVLLFLVEHRDRYVSRNELLEKFWQGSDAYEETLTKCISTIRTQLNDPPNAPRFIETRKKVGYRYIGPFEQTSVSAALAEVPVLEMERLRGVSVSIDEDDEQPLLQPAVIPAELVSPPPAALWWERPKLVVLASLVLLAGLTLLWLIVRSRSTVRLVEMEARKLTNNSKATTAAISPDGKLLVYSKEEDGRQSLWLKQIATMSEVQIIQPAEVIFYGSTFTADGNYLFYVMQERNRSTGIYQMAVMGGSPRKILEGLDGPITLSPDGQQLAFVRLDESETSLWVVNVNGVGARKLATRKGSEWFDHGVGIGPSWSPDGKLVACSVGGEEQGRQYHRVMGVDVETGEQRLITSQQGQRWGEGGQVAWRRDGRRLLLVSDEQIWQIDYPGSEARRITNDVNEYIGISLTADSDALVTVQLDNESSIWVAPEGDTASSHPIASGRREGYQGLSWTPDNRIVYASLAGGDLDLWLMAADGTDRKQLTANAGANYGPSVSSDDRYIVFASNRTGTTHIWRMNIDGSNPKQLTNGIEERWPECSADGKWVIYVSFAASTVQNLWKVPIEGGDPVPVTTLPSNVPAISPDGKLLAFRSGDGRNQPLKISVMSFPEGRLVKTFNIEPTTIMTGDYKVLRWTPDGRGLAYLDSRTGTTNIWIRSLDGSPERQLTDFKSERMFRFDWSRDGKYLAATRGAMMKDLIRLRGFD